MSLQLDGCLLKYTPPKKGKVTIGGRVYPTVRIGNQWWMAENLDLDAGTYYQYPDHPEYGRYYYDSSTDTPFSAITAQLPEGWRIPSSSDFETLIQATSPDSGTKLKSTTGWTSGTPGTDEFGFNAKAYGRWYYFGNPRWNGVGIIAQYWTSDLAYQYETGNMVRNYFELYLTDAEVGPHFIDDFYHNIRLVKDAT